MADKQYDILYNVTAKTEGAVGEFEKLQQATQNTFRNFNKLISTVDKIQERTLKLQEAVMTLNLAPRIDLTQYSKDLNTMRVNAVNTAKAIRGVFKGMFSDSNKAFANKTKSAINLPWAEGKIDAATLKTVAEYKNNVYEVAKELDKILGGESAKGNRFRTVKNGETLLTRLGNDAKNATAEYNKMKAAANEHTASTAKSTKTTVTAAKKVETISKMDAGVAQLTNAITLANQAFEAFDKPINITANTTQAMAELNKVGERITALQEKAAINVKIKAPVKRKGKKDGELIIPPQTVDLIPNMEGLRNRILSSKIPARNIELVPDETKFKASIAKFLRPLNVSANAKINGIPKKISIIVKPIINKTAIEKAVGKKQIAIPVLPKISKEAIVKAVGKKKIPIPISPVVKSDAIRTIIQKINSIKDKIERAKPTLTINTDTAKIKLQEILLLIEKIKTTAGGVINLGATRKNAENAVKKTEKEAAKSQAKAQEKALYGGYESARQARSFDNRNAAARRTALNKLLYQMSGNTSFGSQTPVALQMFKGMGMMYGVGSAMSLISNSFSQATDYQNMMTTAQQIMKSSHNASPVQMNQVARKARDIGMATKFTAPEVAGAVKFMAMAGMRPESIMASISPVANLALIGDNELGFTADKLTNIKTAFGVEDKDMKHLADAMTNTFTKSNVNLEQMAESMQYVAPVAHLAKLTPEDVLAIIGTLGNAGIQASMAGTTLRQMIQNMLKMTDKQAAEWKMLGISPTDANGDLRDLPTIFRELQAKVYEKGLNPAAEMFKLFRVSAASGGGVFLNEWKNVEKLRASNQTSDGLSDRLALEKQNTIQGRWAQVQSAFTEMVVRIFESNIGGIQEMLSDAVKWLKSDDALKTFQEIFAVVKDIVELGKTFLGYWKGLYDAFGPLIRNVIKFQFVMTQFGYLVTPFKQLYTTLTSLKTVIWGINAANEVSGVSAIAKNAGLGYGAAALTANKNGLGVYREMLDITRGNKGKLMTKLTAGSQMFDKKVAFITAGFATMGGWFSKIISIVGMGLKTIAAALMGPAGLISAAVAAAGALGYLAYSKYQEHKANMAKVQSEVAVAKQASSYNANAADIYNAQKYGGSTNLGSYIHQTATTSSLKFASPESRKEYSPLFSKFAAHNFNKYTLRDTYLPALTNEQVKNMSFADLRNMAARESLRNIGANSSIGSHRYIAKLMNDASMSGDSKQYMNAYNMAIAYAEKFNPDKIKGLKTTKGMTPEQIGKIQDIRNYREWYEGMYNSLMKDVRGESRWTAYTRGVYESKNGGGAEGGYNKITSNLPINVLDKDNKQRQLYVSFQKDGMIDWAKFASEMKSIGVEWNGDINERLGVLQYISDMIGNDPQLSTITGYLNDIRAKVVAAENAKESYDNIVNPANYEIQPAGFAPGTKFVNGKSAWGNSTPGYIKYKPLFDFSKSTVKNSTTTATPAVTPPRTTTAGGGATGGGGTSGGSGGSGNSKDYANRYSHNAARPTQIIFNIDKLANFDKTQIMSASDREISLAIQDKISEAVLRTTAMAMNSGDNAGYFEGQGVNSAF